MKYRYSRKIRSMLKIKRETSISRNKKKDSVYIKSQPVPKMSYKNETPDSPKTPPPFFLFFCFLS